MEQGKKHVLITDIEMAPKFGTSGVRGRVTELTDDIVSRYVSSFITECDTGSDVFVGWDLRESSPDIAKIVMTTVRAMGRSVVNCGVLPTPALAFSASQSGGSAIMITGSHIPADRNGIKFYTVYGEISKADEARIVGALDNLQDKDQTFGPERKAAQATQDLYIQRYTNVFSTTALAGLKIGVYQHSSVARDILVRIFNALGAEVVPLERTTEFVPVDTEAVNPVAREKFKGWCQQLRLDALVSTDGDADRPMLTDENGVIVPGDTLGAITALYLGADTICTPVSSNTMINVMPGINRVIHTQIGSPFVVAAMQAQPAETKIVGYEANGGFLLGFPVEANGSVLQPLLTRDCALPIIATLVSAHSKSLAISTLVERLPKRFTASDRIAEIPTEKSKAFISMLMESPAERASFFDADAPEVGLNVMDGLRVTFDSGDIVHLRPSGNAPEFRCYAEAEDPSRARTLVTRHLAKVEQALGASSPGR